jgi:hypothetical protein
MFLPQLQTVTILLLLSLHIHTPQMDHNARSFQTELRRPPVFEASLALLISLKRACAVRERRVETVCSAFASDLGSGHLFKCAHA